MFILIYFIISASFLLLASNDVIGAYGHLVYLPVLLYLIFSSISSKMGVVYYLRPDSLLLLYLNINYFVGHYLLENRIYPDIGSVIKWEDYHYIPNLGNVMLYILICNATVIILQRYSIRKAFNSCIKSEIRRFHGQGSRVVLMFSFIVFCFTIYDLDLSILGGFGSFSVIPMSVIAIYYILYLTGMARVNRILMYIIILTVFALINYESKREVFYLFIPILFLESKYGAIQHVYKLKSILLTVLAVLLSIYLVLAMTISRGFGQYELTSPLDSFKLVGTLVSEFDILPILSYLSETPTFTYTSYRSISIFENEQDILLGSTYSKSLFIAIPRTLYPNKPLSATSIYTRIEYPSFYNVGGSYPVSLYSDAYMNFRVFGFIPIILILIILNHIFVRLHQEIEKQSNGYLVVALLYAMSILPGFYRGYGIDLYIVYVIVGFFFSYIYSYLMRLENKKIDNGY